MLQLSTRVSTILLAILVFAVDQPVHSQIAAAAEKVAQRAALAAVERCVRLNC